VNKISVIGFDYSILDASVAADVRGAANRIKGHNQKIQGEVIKIGLELIEIKAKLSHGSFGPWLDAEFQMSERTGQNYMNYAAWAPTKSAIVADLPMAIGYALSAPTAPPEVVEQVLADVGAGKTMTVKIVRDRLNVALDAHKKADTPKSIEQAKKDREAEKRRRAKKEADDLKVPLIPEN
jgi:DUF3102 family protein